MDLVKWWLTAIVRPARAMDDLGRQRTPHWGLRAVLIRFVGTSLFVALPLALLARKPFQQSYLTFVQEEHYYWLLVFLFPAFGLAVWLLMAAFAHVTLRMTSLPTDFDQVANIIGMSMLTPMLVVWVWDATMVWTGAYGLTAMAISHSAFQVWETVLGVLGFERVLGLRRRSAVLVAVSANLIYVLMGALISR